MGREQENLNTQASTKNTLSLESLEQQNTAEKPDKKLSFEEEHGESPSYKKSQKQEKKDVEESETPEGEETSELSDFWIDKMVNPLFDFIATSMGTFMSLFQSDEYLEEFNQKYGDGSQKKEKKSLQRNQEEEGTPNPDTNREYQYQEEEKSKGRQYQRQESPQKELKERDENEFWLREETPPPGHESSQKTYPIEEEFGERVPLLDKISAGYESLSGSLRKFKDMFRPAKKEINLNFEEPKY